MSPGLENRKRVPFSNGAVAISMCLSALLAHVVVAQELVPAAYTPAPYGVNLVNLTAAYNDGDLAFDPSGPIDDASGQITFSSLGFARTFDFAGRSANIGIYVPYVVGHLEGLYLGEQAYADRSGLGDMGVRVGVNLYGAPAMSLMEFRSYRPGTLIGASLLVKAPTGQYDPLKLINIGTNRWSFKPEIGFVRVMDRWAIDGYVGGWFYTDNTDFFGGLTREQDPILSTQCHARYLIKPGLWVAVDGNFWWGGQTTVNGVESDDLQRNSRVGATVAIQIRRNHSLRIAASTGAFTRIGGDFNSIGVAYGYSWAESKSD
ncbi:MAG: transporter [Acidobacteria bacterium]|nr:transporter [Acidobacteriota bacterium]